MSYPLLLDEMLSGAIAEQLRAKGHDALAVVDDPALISLPDDQILARATAAGRALVTANIKDFMPLDAQYRAAGQAHCGRKEVGRTFGLARHADDCRVDKAGAGKAAQQIGTLIVDNHRPGRPVPGGSGWRGGTSGRRGATRRGWRMAPG